MTEEALSGILPELFELRQELHRHPELSGQEVATAKRLQAYLQQYQPSQLIGGLGSGTGLAAVFEGAEEGPTLMFRADMDALPIAEQEHRYSSQRPGISHKCGHDGHMSMVAGLAPLLFRHPLKKGKVVLLMQPAEETGQGARALLDDLRFRALKPDYIFGLHNLPAIPLGQVVLRSGTFCAASRGLRIGLRGLTAHAAEPEKGKSPAPALAQLLQLLPLIPARLPSQDLLMLTITHAQLGEATFGTSPGEVVLQVTLRANLDAEMQLLTAAVEESCQRLANEQDLRLDLSYHEVFPVTENKPAVVDLMARAAASCGLPVHYKTEPFRWSEDFGWYQQLAPAGFFGLGAGEQQVNLHHAAYDFPDALIPYGLRMYWSLVQSING